VNLLAAILALLTLPHGKAFVRECRELPQGCEAHAVELEHAITGASVAHDVDPRLLTAIAYHESSLTGRDNATSMGVWGWHRRSKLWGKFRAECGGSGATRAGHAAGSHSPDAVMPDGGVPALHHCLDIQADLTAAYLRELLLHCGSWDGALSFYQSGKCKSDSGVRYARRVAQIAGAL